MSACLNHPDVAEGVRPCSRCANPYCSNCLVEIEGRPYCATCKTQQLLDVRSGVDATRLDYAGIGKRFVASFIDGLITGIPTLLLLVPLLRDVENPPLFSWTMLLPAILAVVYEAVMLTAKGQTLGKMAMKVKVVRPDGSHLTGGQAWGRALSRFVLGLIYLVGPLADYISAFVTKEKTTLHDMIAKTRVVNWA